MYFRNLLAAIFLLIGVTAFTQTKTINQLKTKVDAATNNDEKLAAIVAYCEDYSNISHDSLEKYAYIAIDLANKSHDEKLKALARLTLAQDFLQWGWTDSVHVLVDNELQKITPADNEKREIYFRLKKLKAIAYGADGRLKESLEILYPLEVEAEKYKDSLLLTGLSNIIGSIAAARNELNEAWKWNNKALAYSSGTKTKYLGSVLISRAQLMYKEDKTDSCLYFLQRGLALCEQIEMNDRLAGGYRFQSAVYTDLGRLDAAEVALKNMQAARNKITNNPDAIIDDNIQIADFYANTGQLKKAIAFCWSKLDSGDYHTNLPANPKKAYNNDPAVRLPFYLALARYLKEDKDYPAYQNVLEEIIVLKDTLSEINKTEAIAEIQTKYNVEQKEKTIISQQLKLTRKNYLLYGSLIFIAMAGIIMWLWLRNERIKQTTKMQQAIDNEKKQAAQSILDAEEKERKRIAADLHDNIGAYASAISADVENIVGKGVANSADQLDSLQQHSREIIYSLRDTIWVLNKENITITGISDRIKNYINKLKPTYNNINIEVKENISNDAHVGSQKALNIFRIMQEAVHNALKHSNANNVLVHIESAGNIHIAVKDDGIGILDKKNNDGNGLRNMQARANEAGLNFSFESEAGKGTTIMLAPTTN